MAKLSPLFNEVTLDDSGNPASGWKINTYIAGSNTPATTYTSEDGGVAQSNPIVLNARGEPDSPIWLTEGTAYKFVLTDADDVVKRTVDDVTGIGDNSITLDQWVVGPSPAYVSSVSFTLVGDQSSAFHVHRRVKATVTAGTVYGTIAAVAYTSLTTVTVALDSGSLDAGLSSVSLGLLTYNNTSMPAPQNASITAAKIAGDDTTISKILDMAGVGIGGYTSVQIGLTGAAEPPSSHFIRLKSGLTDAGEYNEGKLTSESVTGSAPLITATAVIDDAASPLDGQTVHLLEDEGRFLRSGNPGTLQDDAMQQITGTVGDWWVNSTQRAGQQGAFNTIAGSYASTPSGGGGVNSRATFDSANSPNARTANETRPRNIGVAVYMRIK